MKSATRQPFTDHLGGLALAAHLPSGGHACLTYRETSIIDPGLSVKQGTRGVKNVIVYIDQINHPVGVDTEHHLVVRNKDCAFQTRVGTLTVGQRMEIVNDWYVCHKSLLKAFKVLWQTYQSLHWIGKVLNPTPKEILVHVQSRDRLHCSLISETL